MTSQLSLTRSPRRIVDALRGTGPVFSFEFFPPKSPGEARLLERTITELVDLRPTFVSVTDRAGSAAQGLTREVVARIGAETGLTAMAHLTCRVHSRDEMRAMLADLRDAGVENVLALRGDPPPGGPFVPPVDGFGYADQLVRFIREEGFDFCLGGACYPEGHIECADRAEDIANAKHKVEAGVDFLITQLFHENAYYFDFVARAREAGITVPIIPGVMPVTNLKQIPRFTREWGVTIPTRLLLALERCETDAEVFDVGVRWATTQCRELLARGAPGIHFYTLNRSPATRLVLEAIRTSA